MPPCFCGTDNCCQSCIKKNKKTPKRQTKSNVCCDLNDSFSADSIFRRLEVFVGDKQTRTNHLSNIHFRTVFLGGSLECHVGQLSKFASANIHPENVTCILRNDSNDDLAPIWHVPFLVAIDPKRIWEFLPQDTALTNQK